MKKLVFLSALLLLLASCDNSTYKVTVNFIGNELDGKTAYLTNFDTGDTVATAVIENKTCLFEGKTEKPFLAVIYHDETAIPFFYQLIVEPGKVNVEIGKLYSVSSPLNDLMTEQMDKHHLSFHIGYEQDLDNLLQLYQENKDNLVGQWAFCQYLFYNEDLDENGIDNLLKEAPAEYAQLHCVEKAKYTARQAALTSEGKKYIDYVGIDTEGKTHKLSDLIGKGKPTVLCFFWTRFCDKENNGLLNINQVKKSPDFGDKFELIGISFYDTAEEVNQFVYRNNIDWPVLICKTQRTPLELYGYTGCVHDPYFIIFDSDGNISQRGTAAYILFLATLT